MVRRKKLVKATTKRGKVTRIPSKTKAKTADKTAVYYADMESNYLGLQVKLAKEWKAENAKYTKNLEQIEKYKKRIEVCKDKIKRYAELKDESYYGKRSFRGLDWLDYSAKIHDARDNIIPELKRKIAEYEKANYKLKLSLASKKNAIDKLDPLYHYHQTNWRKAIDRRNIASNKQHSRHLRLMKSDLDYPMTRK